MEPWRQRLQRAAAAAADAFGADLPLGLGHVQPAAVAPLPDVALSAAATAVSEAVTSMPVAATPMPEAATTAAPADVDPARLHAEAAAALQALRAEVLPCTRCKLHHGRKQVVFGEGNAQPRVLFIGEAPGAR
ncbi:MAG TPA: uracil-DNA glycosylase, partial [Planctomycetota bacterium]|nr:uracil-DNA glycosylase [Planctomycetota bacterium]